MPDSSHDVFHGIAKNYCLCLADFPPNLKPEHLDVPVDERADVFTGLISLRQAIGAVYDYFAGLKVSGKRWEDPGNCAKAFEAPVKLLWALGVASQLTQDAEGVVLKASRADLEQALKRCSGKDPAGALDLLNKVGFAAACLGTDGRVEPGGYKLCSSVSLGHPADGGALLRALRYYAPRLPRKVYTQKSIIFEVFLRADFRPLLPGYRFRMPHLPAEEQEATRTFDPSTLVVWKELSGFMAGHYPQYRLYFRVPLPGGRRWVADYSDKDGDYGLWSIFVDMSGLTVRVVFDETNRSYLLDRVGEFTPGFQEVYLDRVRCKDCVRCGKHVFYTHGDHVHRLCKAPWYTSPPLRLEDLPDIERLVDYRLANLS